MHYWLFEAWSRCVTLKTQNTQRPLLTLLTMCPECSTVVIQDRLSLHFSSLSPSVKTVWSFFFTLIYGLTQLLPPACSWNLPVLLLLFNYSQTCKCCCNIKPIAVLIFWSRSARKKGFARFHFTALWRLLAMTWIHTCFINSHKSLMLIGRPGLEIVTEFTHLWFLWTLATT